MNQEYLREHFDYHPDGFLTIRKKTSPFSNRQVGDVVGCPKVGGWIRTTINKKHYFVHRLIYIWHHGEIEHHIDHINGDPGDNRIENLRDVTLAENQHNRKDQREMGVVRTFTDEDGARRLTEEYKQTDRYKCLLTKHKERRMIEKNKRGNL